MFRIFIILIVLLVPAPARAYVCIDVEPEKVLEEAYFIGTVKIEKIIDRFPEPNASQSKTPSWKRKIEEIKDYLFGRILTSTNSIDITAKPGDYQYDVVISPMATYKGDISSTVTLPWPQMECAIKGLEENLIRDIILLKGKGSVHFAPTTYKLTEEIWAKLKSNTKETIE